MLTPLTQADIRHPGHNRPGCQKLDTSDPWPLVIAGVVVLLATAVAAFAPARRAARVDPTIVLRAD